MASSSEEDVPLMASTNLHKLNGVNGISRNQNGKRPLPPSSDISDNERPQAKRIKAENAPPSTVHSTDSRKQNVSNAVSDDSDEDVPLSVMTTQIRMSGARAAVLSSSPVRPSRKSAAKSYKDESDDSDSLSDQKDTSKKQSDVESTDSSGSEDEPLAKRTVKSNGINGGASSKPGTNGKMKGNSNTDLSSDDDTPLAARRNTNVTKATSRKRIKKEESDVDMSSDREKPAKPRGPPRKRVKKEEDDEDIKGNLSSSPKKKGKVKIESPGKTPKRKREEEEEEVFKWWENEAPADVEGDGTKKWDTLQHNGVLFPPPYEPLPKSVKLLYDGQPVDLQPEAEEVAGFFAAMLETSHAQDSVFQANFFKDFQTILRDHPPLNGIKIKLFEKCDFRPMAEHIEAEKVKAKRMTKDEKKAAKEKREKDEAPYATCFLNGRPEKVGNFRIEPPGLFRGRGEHPRKGCLKKRVRPEDIVINIGEDEKVPTPNMPGKWKTVQHNNTVTWLAHWKENVNGQCKYVFLAATSSIKGKSDRDKFEKARELKNYIDRIRQDYTADLKSKITADRQRATAMYLIDKYALRAGNEKGEDEADTVGCCSLRCEHISLDKSGRVTLDFLGKDSIRYYKEIDDIDPQVFKNLRLFKGSEKKDTDLLFDRVTTMSLNAHLRSYMKGLTAKVFRTYNASTLFEVELSKVKFSKGALQQEKVNAYNSANKMAAELCNHQKAASKTHEAGMAKMGLHTSYLKHQRMGYRRALFDLDPKQKKKYPEYLEPESELEDDEEIEAFQDQYLAEKTKELEEAWKRSEKTLIETGAPSDEIKEKKEKVDNKIQAVKEEYDRWVHHRKAPGWTFLNKEGEEINMSVEKCIKAIQRSDEAISKTKLKRSDKESLKTISLTTSKINYLDPRITAAYCAKHELPITLFFQKALRKKFPWAMGVDADWTF